MIDDLGADRDRASSGRAGRSVLGRRARPARLARDPAPADHGLRGLPRRRARTTCAGMSPVRPSAARPRRSRGSRRGRRPAACSRAAGARRRRPRTGQAGGVDADLAQAARRRRRARRRRASATRRPPPTAASSASIALGTRQASAAIVCGSTTAFAGAVARPGHAHERLGEHVVQAEAGRVDHVAGEQRAERERLAVGLVAPPSPRRSAARPRARRASRPGWRLTVHGASTAWPSALSELAASSAHAAARRRARDRR